MEPQSEKIYLLNKRLHLFLAPDGLNPGLDCVMLAAACPAKTDDSVLDLGCGIGSAGLCVLQRVPGANLAGIDIQSPHIELAAENAVANSMAERCHFIAADVRNFEDGPFDHVICNPPYLEAGTATPPAKGPKATANAHSPDTNLKDWIDAAFRNLKSRGSLTLIHRADQLDTIIRDMGKRFGAIEIIPLWPRAGVQAKRVIIRAVKDRRSSAIFHAGIVLHEENGDYTKEAEAILREAKAL